MDLRLHIDSTAALSLVHKTGLGKAKHIEMQHLWIQCAVEQGRFKALKVHTDINPADLMTKALHEERVLALMRLMAYRPVTATLVRDKV